jgi:hypothetical protein
MALDATSRETCTIRRVSTNTPIAAFVLLNDPAYVEAAQSLAKQVMQYENADPAARATYAFRRALARPPSQDEVQRLVKLFTSEQAHYQHEAEAARKMTTIESTPSEDATNLADLAAWTVISNVLLNLDETLNN